MARVRLEIDEVNIYRPKKRWNLYFVVAIEHPTDENKMIITTLPKQPIKLTKRHNNSYQFDSDEFGSEGLLVLSRELPLDRELNAHIYLRHTRESIKNLGELLEDIASGIGKKASGIINDLVSTTTTPWLVIAKEAIPIIGKVLTKIPDRDFGFLSAFERFCPEFETQLEIDRKKNSAVMHLWSTVGLLKNNTL